MYNKYFLTIILFWISRLIIAASKDSKLVLSDLLKDVCIIPYGPVTRFGTYFMPTFVAMGDFNNDNQLDIAVANCYGRSASILIGNGNGTFKNHVDLWAGGGSCSVTAGDFNNDHNLDIATADNGQNDVGILFGDGKGSFSSVQSIGGLFGPNFVTAGDLNDDKNLDLVVALDTDTIIQVIFRYGNGTFHDAIRYTTGQSSKSAAIGHFNSDNKQDLAVGNSGENNMAILLNPCA